MKNLFFVLLLFIAACSQDNDNQPTSTTSTPPQSNSQIPDSIYGTFDGHTTCVPSGTYNQHISIFHYSSTQVMATFQGSSLTGDTLFIKVNGSALTVESQTFINTGWAGGTYSVIGSGTFSYPQLTLTLGISLSAVSDDRTCTYLVSK